MVEYNSFTVHYHQPLSQISMTDTYVITQHCINIINTYLYKILINKRNKKLFNYINAVINYYIIYHTVTIQHQCSVQYPCILMYTVSFIQYNQGYDQCLSHTIPGYLWRSLVSVHVSTSVVSPAAVHVCQQRLRKLKENNTCYSKPRYIHGIHIMKIHAVNYI